VKCMTIKQARLEMTPEEFDRWMDEGMDQAQAAREEPEGDE